MASDDHAVSIEMQHHYLGADKKAPMWMRQNVGEVSWDDGLKATIDSAFGSNIIIYFEGDDGFECYVIKAGAVAQAARSLRAALKAAATSEQQPAPPEDSNATAQP